MIYTSEKHIKPKYGKSFFGDKVSEEIDVNKNYAISDGGFMEELYPIINKVGYDNMVLVQLVRDGCSYSSDSRRYFNGKPLEEYVISHETDLIEEHLLPEEIPILTYRIHNNGSLPEFYNILDEIHNKLN